jgi:hypothetical protein
MFHDVGGSSRVARAAFSSRASGFNRSDIFVDVLHDTDKYVHIDLSQLAGLIPGLSSKTHHCRRGAVRRNWRSSC